MSGELGMIAMTENRAISRMLHLIFLRKNREVKWVRSNSVQVQYCHVPLRG